MDGRFMNIDYVLYDANEVASPTTEQVIISSCTFKDNKADGSAGLMKLNVDLIRVRISSSSFETHSSLINGGVL